MINILLTGIGGQGTILAAKMLAQAAHVRGWQVRTAETIGMAQRGGSVVSHIRIGNLGEEQYEPLLAHKSADLIIAFEPAEAARMLSYLADGGIVVSARSTIQPVSAALAKTPYREEGIRSYLETSVPNFVAVDDKALCNAAGSRKVLNTILLACALVAFSQKRHTDGFSTSDIISIEDLKEAVCLTVKPHYVDMNLNAIALVESSNLQPPHKEMLS